MYVASSELDRFLNESVYSVVLRTCKQDGNALIAKLKELATEAEGVEDRNTQIGPWNAYQIGNLRQAFSAVMNAEFQHMPMFMVTPKKGYDVMALIYTGSASFPNDLARKVPESIVDIEKGTQCVAFEFWTAAAFHFHRATESVLRKYWEAVRPGKNHPGNKTIGDYLTALK